MAYRDLTYIGRITVIETLALPILVHILRVLPHPPVQVMKEIQDIFYILFWDGKPDKIKRNVSINNYEEGRLKLPHIESFCRALKMSWLLRLLDPMNMFSCKMLLLSYMYIEKYWRDKILYLKKEGLAMLFLKS
jgi:hypothetical protein